MSTNAEAYSDDLKAIAKTVVEERASRRSDKKTLSTTEVYKEASDTATAVKAKKPAKKATPPKKAPAPAKDRAADADDKS